MRDKSKLSPPNPAQQYQRGQGKGEALGVPKTCLQKLSLNLKKVELRTRFTPDKNS